VGERWLWRFVPRERLDSEPSRGGGGKEQRDDDPGHRPVLLLRHYGNRLRPVGQRGSVVGDRDPGEQVDSRAVILVAEAEGFEPSRELPPYTLSRRVPSTARPSLRGEV
jgi:hypothetical protein